MTGELPTTDALLLLTSDLVSRAWLCLCVHNFVKLCGNGGPQYVWPLFVNKNMNAMNGDLNEVKKIKINS